MTRQAMARWLAAASAVLVALLAALFALLHNWPGRDPRLAAPPVAAPPRPPADVPPAPIPAPPTPPAVAQDDARVVPPPVAAPPVVAAPPPRPVAPVAKAVAPAAPAEPKVAPGPAPPPPATKIDPERIAVGERAYARLGCALCHSIGGRGNPASPLDGVGARLDRQALYELTTGTGAAAEVLGPALARRKARAVGDPDMEALIDYLAQLR